MEADMKEIKFEKVSTRLLKNDADRLRATAIRNGFRSEYGLLRYLIYAFLRVADPDNDMIDTPMPVELIDILTPDSALKADIEAVYESIRRVTYAHNIQRYNAKAGRTGKKQTISDEISEMFAQCEAEGTEKTFPADIKKRTPK